MSTGDGATGTIACAAGRAERVVRRTSGGAHGLLAPTLVDEGHGVKAVAKESLGISLYQPLPVREQ